MNIFYFIKKSLKIQYNAYIASTPIPGYKFTNCYSNKFQQVIWHVAIFLSMMIAFSISCKFWYRFENKSTLPVYEMLEQGIRLPFPAVYACMGYPLNPKNLEKYRKYILKPNLTMSYQEIDQNLQSMLRFQRSTKKDKTNLDELFLHNVDIEKLRDYFLKLYYGTNELLKDCYVQKQRVNCEDIFIPFEVAAGYCFVFNSIYTQKNFQNNPLKVDYRDFSEFDDDWTIRFKISYQKDTVLLIYLKDPRNALSLVDYPNYVWRARKPISQYAYTITNQYSEEKNRKLKLSQRRCIFSDEKFPYKELNEEFATNFYDQGICYNYCHTIRLKTLCKCIQTFGIRMFPKLANKTRTCRITDLLCYNKNYLAIRRHECKECLSNCNRTTYVSKPEIQEPDNIEYYIKSSTINSSGEMDFTIDLQYWPLLQTRILNIFSTTEFIMALSGAFSLFLGTSMISFLDGFYCFFIRYPFSYFLNRDYIEKAIKKQEEIDAKKPLPCINMSLKPGLKK